MATKFPGGAESRMAGRVGSVSKISDLIEAICYDGPPADKRQLCQQLVASVDEWWANSTRDLYQETQRARVETRGVVRDPANWLYVSTLEKRIHKLEDDIRRLQLNQSVTR